jgi:flagellar basal-body rod protein FlgB
MGVGQLPLFTALKEKMRWHQTRQSLLAENVANAETPNYRGRDLKAFSFQDHMKNMSTGQVRTVVTQPGHMIGSSPMNTGFAARSMNSFEITPEGNGVTLEDESMKVAANQMDYQAVTTLYQRSMRIVRTALGR